MTYEEAVAKCNPIERKMLGALLHIEPECMDPEAGGLIISDHPYIRLVPQYQHRRVWKYRLDFALLVNIPGLPEIKLDIECDGHEFHEKTAEQARQDAKRNRHLTILGWKILRFPASDILFSAQACAAQVRDAIDAEFVRLVEAAALEQRRVA